ncbi:hypothetical protein [Allosphingosinicella vermicomposti]|uniref:hypothetical protein n=1 Tax=Allosphingosinicella vermicomposti TaxID=614671 RepID=UPI00131A519F|nr:hypothetical protein [Allosphingosinicella vermicomposti]
MTLNVTAGKTWRASWWRWGMWAGAATLLILPAVAMRFTREVNWTGSDFLFAAILLFGSAGIIDATARSSQNITYKAGVAIAVGTALLTIWANGAVGMIGSQDNPYNLWFLGVVALALIGAIASRFRAKGMVWTMTVAAMVQAALGLAGMSADPRGGIFSTGFAFLWLLSAALLRASGSEAEKAR